MASHDFVHGNFPSVVITYDKKSIWNDSCQNCRKIAINFRRQIELG